MIRTGWTLLLSGLRKPRASGDDPIPGVHLPVHNHVNPARAGMIPYGAKLMVMKNGKPRASGDDPAKTQDARLIQP